MEIHRLLDARSALLVVVLLANGVAQPQTAQANTVPNPNSATNPPNTPLVMAPAAPTATLTLIPPSGELPANKPFAVQVQVNGAADMAAWEFDLSYDSGKLEVDSLTAAPAFAQTGLTCDPSANRCAFELGPVLADNVASNGIASIGALSFGNGPAMSGDGIIATIYFQPKLQTGDVGIAVIDGMALNRSGQSSSLGSSTTTVTLSAPQYAIFLPLAIQGAPTGVALSAAAQNGLLPIGNGQSSIANLQPSSATVAVCPLADYNCDQTVDIRDLQPVAGSYGAISGTVAYSRPLDLNLDGVIDRDDLIDQGPIWHSDRQTGLSGVPRLGYASSGNGQVFLRWSMPTSPYSGTATIVRQNAGAAPEIVARIDPIFRDEAGLPLLGDATWNIIRGQISVTTDISGVVHPMTLTHLSEMHESLVYGQGNRMLITTLMNFHPGVARVMGRGYLDLTASGVVTYWVRQRGRTVGPLKVNAGNRSAINPPQTLSAFAGDVNVTGSITKPRELANAQRFAHATIFLKWEKPIRRPNNPIWSYGYNLYRKACDPANLSSCTDYAQINGRPIQEQADPVNSSTVITTGENVDLQFPSNEPHEFAFDYADKHLELDKVYCYKVAARDLLGQSGELSNESCLRAPDFRGPRPPQTAWVSIEGGDTGVCVPQALVSWSNVADAARYEVYRSSPPEGQHRGEWVLVGQVGAPSIAVSTTGQFQASTTYTRFVLNGNTPTGSELVNVQMNNGQLQLQTPALLNAPERLRLINVETLLNNAVSIRRGGNERNAAPSAVYFLDEGVTKGQRYRYRVVGYDAKGNLGAPSDVVEALIKNNPSQCLPAAPTFGQPVNASTTSFVNLYRKFGSTGQPLLLRRIPSAEWNSSNMTVTDFYSPTLEQNVSYELRAENEYNELSAVSNLLTKNLIPSALRMLPVATPILIDAKLTKANNNGRAKATLEWALPEGVASGVFIYRSKGLNMPTDVANMTLIYSGSMGALQTNDITRTYQYIDNASNLKTSQTYWYVVRASNTRCISSANCPSGYSESGPTSTPRIAYFAARVNEPQHDTDEMNATMVSIGLGATGVGVNWDAANNECCFVVFRSSDKTHWTQLTPPIVGNSYADVDPAAHNDYYRAFHGGDWYYQVLKFERGTWTGGSLNATGTTGEIISATGVLTYAWAGATTRPGTSDYTGMGATGVLPPTTPRFLHFGTFTVEVNSGINSGITNTILTGDGVMTLTLPGAYFNGLKIGALRRVKVEFQGVTAGAVGGVVTGFQPGGFAKVKLGTNSACYLDDRSSYVAYQLCDVTLDQNGMQAGQLILTDLGKDMVMWDVDAANIGARDVHTFTNVVLTDNTLAWSKSFPGNNVCSDPIDQITHMVSHRDWPILIVPTGAFTYTEQGITWSNTCTLFRTARYNNSYTVPAGMENFRNDGFLQWDYTGTSASYTPGNGLTGTWDYSAANKTFSTVWPWNSNITGRDWRFSFVNGDLSSGFIKRNSAFSMLYAAEADQSVRSTFSGNFGQIDIGLHGALYGPITPTTPITWAAFSFTGTDALDFYAPAALTPSNPKDTWLAERGKAASGQITTTLTDNEKDQNAGVNVFKRGLVWDLSGCPAPSSFSSSQVITFAKTANSGLKLYFRNSGANGQVNMVPSVAQAAFVGDFRLDVTRFSQSWLNGGPHSAGGTGNLNLPFPANMSLSYIGLGVDVNGCVAGGNVLPQPGVLDYWDVSITPSAAEFRTNAQNGNTNVWLIGQYEIPHLKRVDGAVDDPAVEFEMSFNHRGNFVDANAYPQPSTYEVDGFYTVIEDVRLSVCNPVMVNDVITQCNGPNGGAPWDESVTTRPGVALGNKGFVNLTAGVYFPWFGEVISTTDTHIYLQGQGADSYIGFNKRPKLDGRISQQMGITLTMDLAFAQAPEGSNLTSRWLGFAKNNKRDILIFEAPYGTVITPDGTSVFFGFPALAAVAEAGYEIEDAWVNGSPGSRSNVYGQMRDELGLSAAAYDTEFTVAAQLADAVAPATYLTLLDELNAEMGTTEDEINAWINANLNGQQSSINARYPFLGSFISLSPVQFKWLRGSSTVQGLRDGNDKLYDTRVSLIELDAYVTAFTQQASTTENKESLFAAAMAIELDTVKGNVLVEANGMGIKMLGNDATIDVALNVYYGGANGYGIHGDIDFNDLVLELGTIRNTGAVFGFTINNNQLKELYVGATIDAQLDTKSMGKFDVTGSYLVGRLDPGQPTLQEDYGDIFDEMNAQPGEIITGLYFAVSADGIPIYKLPAWPCDLINLEGGGSLSLWVFTNANATDTAWGTRIGVAINGEAVCVVAVAASIEMQIDNDFGENGTDFEAEVFLGGGCGDCDPQSWNTKEEFETASDPWCIRCSITVNFIIPLDGDPEPYMTPAPSFSCAL